MPEDECYEDDDYEENLLAMDKEGESNQRIAAALLTTNAPFESYLRAAIMTADYEDFRRLYVMYPDLVRDVLPMSCKWFERALKETHLGME